ncbi:MAG: hypothetical protein L0H03_11385 [Rhodococcus sp. (in: high G+C Gram-positive bacteria)]|nr:hypothetical protein [Rhodococcus sp. (in: high G+C Gram-positive bacteria)]
MLVEDQGFIASSIMSFLGETADNQWSLSTMPPEGGFKWCRSPRTAVDFLKLHGEAPCGWIPDIALVDYHYETPGGDSDVLTGLTVLEALARFAPQCEPVIFSGHATRQGRSLFQAAAYHWFGIRRSLPKGGTHRDLAQLLSGTDSTPHALAVRLHDHARLIDEFFTDQLDLKILKVWAMTHGIDKVMEAAIPASRSTLSRRKKDLATAADAFMCAFDVGLTEKSGHAHGRLPVKETLGVFMANNHTFFADPALESVLRNYGPWSHR